MGSSLAQITYDCQVAWVCVRDFKALPPYAQQLVQHMRASPN